MLLNVDFKFMCELDGNKAGHDFGQTGHLSNLILAFGEKNLLLAWLDNNVGVAGDGRGA